MNKIIFTILISILLSSSVSASPFLVCDPSAQAIGGGYEVWENGTMIAQGSNEPDGSFKTDLKDIAVGSHTVTARYFIIDQKWGTVYSANSVPFTFIRPSLATVNIVGLKLVP